MKLFTLLTVLSLTAIYSFAQPGSLDLTFNDSGKVFKPGFGIARATAVQEDGKILVGGESTSSDEYPIFVITRYLPNGTVDASFGENGIVGGPNSSGIYSIVVLKSGKILASGYGTSSGDGGYVSPLLVQYLPDGTPDPSFGNGGMVALDLSNLEGMVAITMGVLENGYIVQAGSSGSAMNNTKATTVIRYLPDGTPDASFDGDGIYTLPIGQLPTIKALALQPDGKIILGGEYSRGDMGNFYITRLTAAGSIDSSFGINGKRNLNFYGDEDIINALAFQADGKILAAGSVETHGPSTPVMAIVRFKPDGFFDSSFGNNGIAFGDFGKKQSSASSMVLQENGKITLGGLTRPLINDTGRLSFALAQFNPNGSVNNSFGEGGTTTTDFGYYQQINSLSLQADNKIVAAGQVIIPANADSLPYYNLGIARYNNNGTPIAKKIQKILKWWRNRNNSITLNWQNTATGSYYKVQRAAAYNTVQNTGVWVNIGRVVNSNAATNSQTQSFTDNNPLPGTNYYRVQQVNPSGNIETTNIVAVTINQASAISVSPNPVQDVLYIKGLDASARYSLRVANRQGNIVAKAMVKQSSLYKLNVERLPKGVYYLKIASGINTTDLKFVKE